MDNSVGFGSSTVVAARQLNKWHFRACAECMRESDVAVANQEACEMREGTRIHVKHFGNSIRILLGRRPTETLATRHDRPTPACCIQAQGRSRQGWVWVGVLAHELVVVPHLDDMSKVLSRPATRVSLNRPPSHRPRGLEQARRVHGLVAVSVDFHRRPVELRLRPVWAEDHNTTPVGRQIRLFGKVWELLAHALVHRPVGLLAFEGAVADVVAAVAWDDRRVCAARAYLLFLWWLYRRHGGASEVSDVWVLVCCFVGVLDVG